MVGERAVSAHSNNSFVPDSALCSYRRREAPSYSCHPSLLVESSTRPDYVKVASGKGARKASVGHEYPVLRKNLSDFLYDSLGSYRNCVRRHQRSNRGTPFIFCLRDTCKPLRGSSRWI